MRSLPNLHTGAVPYVMLLASGCVPDGMYRGVLPTKGVQGGHIYQDIPTRVYREGIYTTLGIPLKEAKKEGYPTQGG